MGGHVEARLFAKFGDEAGATAIAYGLIAPGISLAIIGMIKTLGGTFDTNFDSLNTQLKAP
jgi:Flp pilus assembly pilin Flp